MATRVVASVAILGGFGLVAAIAAIVGLVVAYPDVEPWWHLVDRASPMQSTAMAIGGRFGIGALGAATVGMVYLVQDRLSWGAAACGVLGGVGAILGMLGAAPFFTLLPIGSAIVVADLARVRLLGWPLAILFIGSAVAFLAVMVPAMGPSRLDTSIALGILYPIAWIALGIRLARGVPRATAVASGT